ncbi:MAG TPA: hypothetical protein PLW34_08230 [Termitinemataceae bacterium]|nr:hypothetical protein [Termitinemataceae bacterium]HOM23767.1 hypothetical protein [Termitinemataceae bacterium]HPQ00806.1 hypothetical protein [Termitinemataceae bacterium]
MKNRWLAVLLLVVNVVFLFADDKSTYLQLLQANKMQELKDYLLTLFAVGKNNDHQWKWSDGQVLENGKAFFVETLQTYIAEWMDSGYPTCP